MTRPATLNRIRRLGLVLWGLVIPAAATAGDFNYQSLQALIARDRISSVEGLLAQLPASFRSHYVLMFSSRSLQQASFRDPRVVLYGSDAHLMLSFNGDPREAGYDTVETAEYDPVQARFRFREIHFPRSTTPSTVEYSHTDPVRCGRCHGEPARPLWDTTPLWPGAYGERYHSSLSSAERTGLRLFLDLQPSHPRYRQLVDAQRLADRNTFVPDAMSRYAGGQAEPPNAEFSRLLARMNAQAILHQLRGQRAYGAYRYALLGVAEGDCGALSEFLPAASRRAAQAALGQFLAAGNVQRLDGDAAKLLRALPARSTGNTPEAAAARATLGAVRFLAQSRLGVSTSSWTLALEKGTFDADPQGAVLLASALREDIGHDDPHIAELHIARAYSNEDRYCAYLQSRSRSAVERLPANSWELAAVGGSATVSAESVPEMILQQCASCHVTGTAPQIAFDEPQALGPLLHQGDYTHGDLLDEILYRLSPQAGAQHMPPGAQLAREQRDVLAQYIFSLAPPR